MYYGAIKNVDIANGVGCRVSLFVSGCRNHCKGCFQPETWDFKYGMPYTTETFGEILELVQPWYIEGLSILGGEPLEPENQQEVLTLCKTVKHLFPNKTIWLYTGYKYEGFIDNLILDYVDVLVDGRFKEKEKNISLRFKGSENQRIIDMNKTRATGQVVLWDGKPQ